MIRTSIFYVVLAGLVVLDSFLISHPNLLGKIGLLVYHYTYLRTFPRALLTVTCVVSVALLIYGVFKFLVARTKMKKSAAVIMLLGLLGGAVVIFVKVIADFSRGTYSHTGYRFKYGVYLLPALLIIIFLYALWNIIVLRTESALNNTNDPNQETSS